MSWFTLPRSARWPVAGKFSAFLQRWHGRPTITIMSKKERRLRRTSEVSRALLYQLEACRASAGLEAVVVSDDAGLCLASAGEPATCEEVAARMPILGRAG